MLKILILCTGNTCRSQMAQGFLQSYDSRLEVFSAGVSPACRVAPEAIALMAEKGIDISGHRTHDVSEYLDKSFDYVISVCDYAKESCPHFRGKVKKYLHFPFPDPYLARGGKEAFMRAYQEVRDAIEKKFKKMYINEFQGEL